MKRPGTAPRRIRIGYNASRKINALVFLLPWLVGFFLFFVSPIYDSFVYSFSKVEVGDEGGMKLSFTGLENYRALFGSEVSSQNLQFLRVFAEENIRIFVNIPIILIFSLFSAILTNAKFRGRGIVRVIFFLPIVIGLDIVHNLLSVTTGGDMADASVGEFFSNGFLRILLIRSLPESVAEFIESAAAGIFNLASSCGVQTLIFLAGLQSIGGAVYEAADIEGANAYEKFWKITFPMLGNNVIIFVIVYSFVDLFLSSNIAGEIYIFAFRRGAIGMGAALSTVYMFNVIADLLLLLFVFTRLQRGSGKARTRGAF
jgi:ABC-type sugar transport system permease subunit